MEPIRVLIAEDSEFIQIAYMRILGSESKLCIVALAADGETAVNQAIEMTPDVSIIDIRMPKLDGIEAVHRILEKRPKMGIVIISAYDDLAFVADLMQDGPERKAFLLKTSLTTISDLIKIVEAVHEGQTVLDPSIIQRLARLYCKYPNNLTATLSETEQDMLGLMAEGYGDSFIGRALHLDDEQIERHSGSIFDKLGLSEGEALSRPMKASRGESTPSRFRLLARYRSFPSRLAGRVAGPSPQKGLQYTRESACCG